MRTLVAAMSAVVLFLVVACPLIVMNVRHLSAAKIIAAYWELFSLSHDMLSAVK